MSGFKEEKCQFQVSLPECPAVLQLRRLDAIQVRLGNFHTVKGQDIQTGQSNHESVAAPCGRKRCNSSENKRVSRVLWTQDQGRKTCHVCLERNQGKACPQDVLRHTTKWKIHERVQTCLMNYEKLHRGSRAARGGTPLWAQLQYTIETTSRSDNLILTTFSSIVWKSHKNR